MRLFVAILLPDGVKQAVIRARNKLGNLSGVRWVAPESMHITLKFLGDAESSKIIDIQSLLPEIGGHHKKLDLSLAGGGVFPNIQRPRILWTAIRGEIDPLKKLADEVAESMESIGFEKEDREFSPHVTVARLKFPVMTAVDQFCTLFKEFSSPIFSASEFHLMESNLDSQGSRYHSLDSFSLVSS